MNREHHGHAPAPVILNRYHVRTASRVATVILAAAMVAAVVHGAAAEEAFPYRSGDTIDLVVPFAPGGGFDVYARMVAPHLTQALREMGGVNVNVVVRNMPGAGGQIAHRHVYAARPDGRSLLVLHGGAVQNYVVLYNLPIDPARFTYLAQIDEFIKGIVVRRDLPFNSFQEMVRYAQTHELRVATGGVGDDPHIDPLLIRELLKREGIDWRIRFVHFEGTGPAKAAIIRGDADVLMTIITSMLDLLQDGDGKLISVVAEERYERFPNVKTLMEERVPGAQAITDVMYAAHILAGPPGMPEPLTRILQEATRQALTSKAFKADAARALRDVHYLPGEAAKAKVLAKLPEIRKYRDLLANALGL